MIDPDTLVDCGLITVEFYNDDVGMTALNAEIFVDDQSASPNNAFRVLYSENVALKGSYKFKYRVYHANYPANVAVQPFPFTITVINSCENPVSLVAPALAG